MNTRYPMSLFQCSVFALALAGLTLGGCASTEEGPEEEKDFSRPLPEGAPALERVGRADWPDLRSAYDQRETLLMSLQESLAYFQKPSSQQWFPYETADRTVTHQDQVRTLELLHELLGKARTPDEFQGYCLLNFDMYRSVGWDGSGEVLFTAYCEPIFEGRVNPDATYRYPLYTLPPDLVKREDGTPLGRRASDGGIEPYPTRREIEEQQLLVGRELVYLKDPFEVYIAHVQGSARVNLDTGEQMCVGYAGKTDRPYESIGLHLVEQGEIPADELSLTTLKKYFRDHPDRTEDILSVNESYVFFTEREPGPFGSIGAKVTPYHSLATDKSVFPRGGPCVTQCRLPVALSSSGQVRFEDRTCLVLDQDTGGAIRSAGRADLFVGTGPEAERLAGHTREVGQLFYFFAKPDK